MELDLFLAPVAGANPSGTELRNDARFHAIERMVEPAARAVRQHSIRSGGTGVANVDWSGALDQAGDLAATGRDLRLLVIVVRALVNNESFAGLAAGLGLLTGTVRQFWDTVHPELRPNPSVKEAAQRRINALLQMQNPDTGVMCDLDFGLVLTPRGLPPVSGGDLAACALTASAYVAEAFSGIGAKETAEAMAAHEARVQRVTTALRDQADRQADRLAEVRAGLADSRARLAELEAALTERVGENGVKFSFPDIDRFLSRANQTLGSIQGGTAESGVAMSDAAPGAAAAPASMPAAAIPGRVNSREDVEKLLGLIIDYYDRTEPSSPIPHMAKRMKKMVPMNFLQLMEELAPSGMKEFKTVAGVGEGNK